jgi:hypothetical protein
VNIDQRLEALATNVELLQGMVRDLTGKVDTLTDTVEKHEQEFQRVRTRMLRAAAALMGMGEEDRQ